MTTAREIRIGIDIGGTFTDAVTIVDDGEESIVAWTKAPSTPRRPVEGVLRAVEKALARVSGTPSTISEFMHATTVGTNAVLEGKGATLGILMTEGFEDTLEIGRQKRSQLYEVFLEPETPGFLCPRHRRLGVRERIGHGGDVLLGLDESDLRAKLRELRERDVDAVAVCYLFSFENPDHELRTRDIAAGMAPEMSISLSHECNPVFREYERLCATAFDAYVRPVMENYLGELLSELRAWGYGGRSVQTMKSRGGLASTEGALRRPGTTILSGPAAGVIGARFVAEASGRPRVITLDMGGTSADVALVAPEKPITATTGRVGRYPLNIPMVDVQTIGAGGGSIAWLDSAGGLRVGPQSAGSDPGPACYGAGGESPTVTDASLVLGYLDPEYFLGGERTLDLDAAIRAIECVAKPLNLSVPEAALGIHRIVNAKMADAIRLTSIKRGYDIRRFSLVVFGGAGPVNGAYLASELGIDECMVPRAASVLSALGLLVSNVEYDYAQTFLSSVEAVGWDRMNEVFARLTEMGVQQMAADGYDADECVVTYSADMRYVGQSSELDVRLSVPVRPEDRASIRQAFEEEHERVYGYAPAGTPIEFVVLRAVHERSPRRSFHDVLGATEYSLVGSEGSADAAVAGTRQCFFAEGEFATEIYERNLLGPSTSVTGPAIIAQEDTTIVVPPGRRSEIDTLGNVLIRS